MDPVLMNSMFEYYDQRAKEYDNLYTRGIAPNSRVNPQSFIEEVTILSSHVAAHCTGKMLDIPAGTGFWLQYYSPLCTDITLVDQSENMLAESRKKAADLDVTEKSRFIQANILEFCLNESEFDSALIGFFLDHLTNVQMTGFFRTLKSVLKPRASVLFMDSVWSEHRQHLKKEGTQERQLQDGSMFDIYKRYFDRNDFVQIGEDNGMEFTILHEGKVYIAAVGRFRD